MNKRIILSVVLIIYLLSCNCLQAGSIWAKRNKDMKDLYADDVARQIGDILTIKITEDSKVDNKAKRDLQKETSRSTTFDGELGIVTDNENYWPRIPGFTMEAESSNELKGVSHGQAVDCFHGPGDRPLYDLSRSASGNGSSRGNGDEDRRRRFL